MPREPPSVPISDERGAPVILPDLHGAMLGDRGRCAAFAAALAAAVRPGDRVLDAGAGTGLLAMLAARSGAGHVVAVEREADLAALAREIVRRNGFADRVEVVHGDARTPPDGPPFDLLVTETVGIFAFDEGITALVDALRPRLAPASRVIPEGIVLHAAPVALPRLARAFARSAKVEGLDYTARVEALRQTPLAYSFRSADFAAPPRALPPVDLRRPVPASLEFEARYEIDGARVDGIGIYFDIELFGGIRIDTGPAAAPTHWGRFVLPLPSARIEGPLEVALRWSGAGFPLLHWSAESRGYAAAGSSALCRPGLMRR